MYCAIVQTCPWYPAPHCLALAPLYEIRAKNTARGTEEARFRAACLIHAAASHAASYGQEARARAVYSLYWVLYVASRRCATVAARCGCVDATQQAAVASPLTLPRRRRAEILRVGRARRVQKQQGASVKMRASCGCVSMPCYRTRLCRPRQGVRSGVRVRGRHGVL